MSITIGNRQVGEGQPVLLIAEAGVNHNGSLERALALVTAAHAAGADAVKFQNFITEKLIRRDAPKAEYQTTNIGTEKTQFQMLKELELSVDATRTIKAKCDELGILFLSTPYDESSVDLLEELGISAYKLASIDVVTHPLIERIAKTNKPLLLSTGMATLDEVQAGVAAWTKVRGSTDGLILLQCTTDYPSKVEEQNLRTLATLRQLVPVVGYSDHTESLTSSIAAVALGANVLERHFTLDRNLPGPDHKASFDPTQFAEFVRVIRITEQALGSSEKKPTAGELRNVVGMRRSICAKVRIPAGTIITQKLLTWKRPGDGLAPTDENLTKLIGKKASRDIEADENVTEADVA